MKQKYHNKYLQKTSIRFNNVWILLNWNYRFCAKRLLDYTNLCSPNEYERNDKIILKYFFNN